MNTAAIIIEHVSKTYQRGKVRRGDIRSSMNSWWSGMGKEKEEFDALKDIIKKNVKSVNEINLQGGSLLARMFSAIYLGDWVSYYMAMLNGVDPSPVPVIMKLKAHLAEK